jgi:hypothetical protein
MPVRFRMNADFQRLWFFHAILGRRRQVQLSESEGL